MERRTFLKSTMAGAVMPWKTSTSTTIPRRVYKGDVTISIIGFGAIVVVGMDQPAADRIVAEAVDRGVNYFDVAPSYFDGEAEMKLGPALKPHRGSSFLACKTMERDAAGSRRELEQSLARLKTDRFDLYQFHAVSKLDDVERIAAIGGAAETFVKAREEGKIRFIGASVHNVEAAFALMERVPLDSVMVPFNFVLVQEGGFGPQIVERARQKGIARIALKSMAHTTWPQREHEAWKKCWYRPVDEPVLAEKAVRFTLGEDFTAAIPPGEEALFRMAMDIASRYRPLDASEREALLASAKGVHPIFHA